MNTRNLLVAGTAAVATFAVTLYVALIFFGCSLRLLSFHLWEEISKVCAIVLLFAALPMALVFCFVGKFAKASSKAAVCAVLCSSLFAVLMGGLLTLHDELSFLHTSLSIKEVMPEAQNGTQYEDDVKEAPRMWSDGGYYCLRKLTDGSWHILLWD